MKYILFLSVLLMAGCRYEANCWVDGENIYNYPYSSKKHHPNGERYCPQQRGKGWYKIPYIDKLVKADCECWIK